MEDSSDGSNILSPTEHPSSPSPAFSTSSYKTRIELSTDRKDREEAERGDVLRNQNTTITTSTGGAPSPLLTRSSQAEDGRSSTGKKQYRLSPCDESILLDCNITVTGHLGEGHFGHVWKGRYVNSGTIRQLDRIPLSSKCDQIE